MSETLSSYSSQTDSFNSIQNLAELTQSSLLHDPASVKAISYPSQQKAHNSFIIGKMKFSRLDSSNNLEVLFENIFDDLEQSYEDKQMKDSSNLSEISESATTKKVEPKKKKQQQQNQSKSQQKKKNHLTITITCKMVNDIKFIQSIIFSSSFIDFYRQTSDDFQTSFHSLSIEDQSYYAIFETAFDKMTVSLKDKYSPYVCSIENYLNRKIDTKVCIEVGRESSKDEKGEILTCQISIIPMDFQSTTNPNLFNKRREGIINNKSKLIKRILSEEEKQFLFLYKECNINQNINVQSDILNYFQTCKYRKL